MFGERKIREEKLVGGMIVMKIGLVRNERNDQEVSCRRERWLGRKEWNIEMAWEERMVG